MFAPIAARTGVQLPSPPAFALRHEKRRLSRRSETKADLSLRHFPPRLKDYGLAGQLILRSQRSKSEGCHAGAKRRRANCNLTLQALRDYGLAGQSSSMKHGNGSFLLRLHLGQQSEQ